MTFPAEATVASFDVSIINDNILERNENFTLTIVMDSLPSKVTTNVTIAHTTVVVIDNDGKYLNSVNCNCINTTPTYTQN